MIITLTANPSLDRTVELPGALVRGSVQRAVSSRGESGGKGVNVCRALAASGVEAVAVLPGRDDDPVLSGLRSAGVAYSNLPIEEPLRSNVTLTEPDGTTTKVNTPGPTLGPVRQEQLIALVVEACTVPEGRPPASWLVLAGSLPPGIPPDFYALTASAVRQALGSRAPRIAIDSSGQPLAGALLHGASPALLKPNSEELAEVSGIGTGEDLEADPVLAVRAARTLMERGVGSVLATLGAKGALLVTSGGSWQAWTPPVSARSTVGAGDSALAGYLIADSTGAPPQECLRQAVAHGAAAASLPGSTVPTLEQTRPAAVTVTEIIPRNAPGTAASAPASLKEEN